jgi:hypothetical protein
MLNPHVSQAYMAYYITHESDLSPTEIRLQKQQADEPDPRDGAGEPHAGNRF